MDPLLVLRAGRCLLDRHLATGMDVVVAGGVITDVRPTGPLPPSAELLAAPDGVLAPGFVDLHVHACGGGSAVAEPFDLVAMAVGLARHGVTSFLATTVTAPASTLAGAVAAANGPGTPVGARCLGVHLEGPWLSPLRAGAQPAEHLRAPDVAELHTLAATGPVRLVTLAPELPGALEVIREAVHLGIRVALGHTDADEAACRAGLAAGASHLTHCFNAMRAGTHRDPGPAALAMDPVGSPDLSVEVIADGVHVHPTWVRALLAARGPEAVCLVSDGVAGLADLCADGTAVRRPDGTLAGSGLMLDGAVANLIAWGVSPVDALLAATWAPAAALALPGAGRIQLGAPADLVLLDAQWRPVTVLVSGRLLGRRAPG